MMKMTKKKKKAAMKIDGILMYKVKSILICNLRPNYIK